MSPIATTAAVVLRSVKFQESSRIVTFYTERHGRLTGIVKGARRNPARFGTSLQPMSQVSLVVYLKPGREVQTVSQCDLLVPYRRIPADLLRLAAGLQMVELVTLVTHDGEENRELHALLVGCLSILDAPEDPGPLLLHHFEISLAGVLGFRPDFIRCAGCGRPFDGPKGGGTITLDVERGGPLCATCDTPGVRGIRVTHDEFRLMREMGSSVPEAGGRIAPPGGIDRIESFLKEYYRFHLPGYRTLRSGEVFRRMDAGNGNS